MPLLELELLLLNKVTRHALASYTCIYDQNKQTGLSYLNLIWPFLP